MDIDIGLIQELCLYLTFSLIFSITLLCTILFIRTRDTIIAHFTGMLYPITILFFFNFLYTYIFATGRQSIFSIKTTEIFALFGSLLLCTLITLVLLTISSYLLNLLPLEDKRKRLGKILSRLLCGIFFFICIFSIILLTKKSWDTTIRRLIRDLFLFGSLFLTIHSIVAIIFLKSTVEPEKKQLLKGIIYSFLPLVLFSPIDFFFLRQSAFKLTFIVYTIFVVSMYLYINRYYIRYYEPEIEPLMPQIDFFCERNNVSKREKEIIHLLIEGNTNKEIAKILYISINTVKTHVKNIYQKLGVTNRVQILYKIKLNQQGE
ncbi:MAG: helix-turn-helix transcriptional regulator [Spirochaetales bacterium]|nr:helix-turn-helix transcriptional regulator [Spirochaetales bacterium]